jgi:hypothetical protein
MASEVGIANAALQLIKNSKTISSFSEGTKEANAVDIIYDEVRDIMLDMHTWNFAVVRKKLGRLDTTPAFEWDYEYGLPSDFIRVVSVHNNSDARDRLPYKVEGGKILTDAQDVYLRYIARIGDPNEMPPTFRAALSKLLASRLAVTLAQSTSLSKEMYAQFIDEDLPTAKSVDAVQDYPDQLPESEWVTTRFGGRAYYNPGDPNV